MSREDARSAIAFRPYIPPRRIVEVALLPPFHGDDERANRGIGIEYADLDGRRYVLAEYPANGGRIDRFAPLEPATAGCAGARRFPRESEPDGAIWSTPSGLIFTLQADGANDWRTEVAEWTRLVRRGACS